MHRFKTWDDHKDWQHLYCRLIWILCWIFHLPFLRELQELIKSLDLCVVGGGASASSEKSPKTKQKWDHLGKAPTRPWIKVQKAIKRRISLVHSRYSLSGSSWTLRIKTMQVQLYILNHKVDVESLCNIESWHFLQESMRFSSKVSISGSRTKQPATTMMMVCISWSPAAGTPHVFWKANRLEVLSLCTAVWNHWQLVWSFWRQGISKV